MPVRPRLKGAPVVPSGRQETATEVKPDTAGDSGDEDGSPGIDAWSVGVGRLITRSGR